MQGKKGLIVVVVALVAVLGLAGAAYAVLGNGGAAPQISSAATTSADATSSASDAGEAESVERDDTLPDGAAGESATDGTSSAGPITLADFTVVDLEGNEVKLSSVYGKPSLVGFWATWCPPCNAEAPEIQKLYEAYGDRINFMMIDAASDGRDTAEKAAEWIKDGGYTYPVFVDETGEASMVAQAYYLPTMYVLDSQGNVLTAFSGAIDEANGKQLCEQLIAL